MMVWGLKLCFKSILSNDLQLEKENIFDVLKRRVMILDVNAEFWSFYVLKQRFKIHKLDFN